MSFTLVLFWQSHPAMHYPRRATLLLLGMRLGLLAGALPAAQAAAAGHGHDGVFAGVLHNRLPGITVPLPVQLSRQHARLTLGRHGKSLQVHTELSSGGKASVVLRSVGVIEEEGPGVVAGTRILSVRFAGADYLRTAQRLVDALALHLGGLKIELIGGESRQTFTLERDGSLSVAGSHAIERAPFPGFSGLVTNRLVPPRILSESSGVLKRQVP